MTRDEGVAMIQQQLAFRTTLASEIVEYMKLAQVTLEYGPVKPWFLISEDTFTSTVVGEERVPIPIDFLQEADDAVLKYRPDDWPDSDEVDLTKEEYDLMKKNFREAGTPPGSPQAYAILGEYFRIAPVSDVVYQIRMIYYKKGALLTTNIENEWLKHVPLLLLGSAGEMISTPARDATASSQFQKWIAVGNAVLNSHNVSRDMANRELQMGGPHA